MGANLSKAFEELNGKLTNAPTLTLSNFSKSIENYKKKLFRDQFLAIK